MTQNVISIKHLALIQAEKIPYMLTKEAKRKQVSILLETLLTMLRGA